MRLVAPARWPTNTAVAELEIELLHEKIDILKERELLALTEAVRHLSLQLEALSQKVH